MQKQSLKVMNKKLFGLFVLMSGIFLVSGCAERSLFYNKSHHQLALNASNAFKEANINQRFDEERARLADINEKSLETVRQHTLAMRDAALIDIVGSEDDRWSLKILTATDKKNKQGLIKEFEGEPVKNKHTVLIVHVDSIEPKVWTIAAFNDDEKFVSKELTIGTDNSLANELNKEKHEKDKIIELATLYIEISRKDWFDRIKELVDNRKKELVSDKSKNNVKDIDFKKLNDLFIKLDAAKNKVEVYKNEIKNTAKMHPNENLPIPSCPFEIDDKDISDRFKEKYDDFKKECKNFLKINEEVANIGGEYKTVIEDISKIETFKDVIGHDLESKKEKYKEALTNYENAVKSNMENNATQEAVDKRLEELKEKIDDFDILRNIDIEALEKKVDILEKLMETKDRLEEIEKIEDRIKKIKERINKIKVKNDNNKKRLQEMGFEEMKNEDFDRFAFIGRLERIKTQKDILEKVIGQISNVNSFLNDEGEIDPNIRAFFNNEEGFDPNVIDQIPNIEAFRDKEGKLDFSKIKSTLKRLSTIKSVSKVINTESIDAIGSISNLVAVLREIPLSALILKKEGLRIEIEGMNKQLVNAEKRLTLLKKKKNAIALELDFLVQADKHLNTEDGSLESIRTYYNKSKKDGNQKITSLKDFIDTDDPKIVERVARFLFAYANSWGIARLIQEEIDYMIMGLRHESILESSEIAVAAWENLIGVSIDQLVALLGAGITPDELAKYLNAAGVTAISIGVN